MKVTVLVGGIGGARFLLGVQRLLGLGQFAERPDDGHELTAGPDGGHELTAVVNVGDLNQFRSGSTVTTEVLVKARLVTAKLDGVRILGFGELTKKLKVKVTGFSATAREKIEKAGGSVEEV